ncbi:hypothetical protein NU10_07900 [Flavobacterium dauae]|uniref:hypothetical protein n=1 Tax=Flavobacterium dauae TaxID=1563479 RepID=UPI00101B28CF|nr:hypothetical protein [Flavobacterium dauae]WLD22659.1 hypothetical protein NU10_07900 [Flavobacterium dauae]
MKKIILFCLGLAITACDDDLSTELTDDNQVTEIPPFEGMKIKLIESENLRGKSSIEFFYNTNGFVDSIHTIKSYILAEKFIYNSLNQITEVRYNFKNPNDNDYSVKNITYYEYNKINQIISLKKYNKNNILFDIQNYIYNPDGTLYNPVKIVKNENLINNNSSGAYYTYTFDSYINPYYNIYPKAYKILNYINKNNVKSKELKTPYQTLLWSYELSYNDDKYITNEIIRDYENGYDYNKFYYYP